MKSKSIFANLVAKSQRRTLSPTAPGGGRAAKLTSGIVRPQEVSSKVSSPPNKPTSIDKSYDDRPIPDYSHLLAAPLHDGIDTSRKDFAAAVIAAGEATRAPAVLNAPKPVGMAKQILNAGQKARTPTGTGAAKPDGLAAQIVAVSQKARKLGQ